MIVPYCIFTKETEPPEIVTGVAETPVQKLFVGSLCALFSEVDALPTEAGEVAQEAMRFQSVVQQAFAAGVVIPFRFPPQLAEIQELRAYLSGREPLFAEALARLSGTAQLEIKITSSALRSPVKPATEQSGTAYLKAKSSELAPLRGAEAQFRSVLDAYGREFVTKEAPGVLRLYVLVEHAQSYAAKQDLASVKLKGVRAVVSGPWPPSEFVGDVGSAPSPALEGAPQ